ncbi:DUF2806 domain-containing protein [Candidatus Tokpelaia sp.]|uniref:DUF2806 domain-containing protein n=1 Tax=Candidatus Tokpelaia sp. TaxID=2233777 RepID=UPI001680D70C|nr:DUF2806 domain-containing protein [Candidatus Tokpelaia sp.]
MPDDVLDNEITVAIEANGLSALPVEIKAKVRSRCLSAIDRFAGNLVDWPNAWLEAGPAKKRAKTEAELAAIKACGETEADAIRTSIGQIAAQNTLPGAFVQKAMEQFCRKAVRSQEKKILLLQETMEDLKQRPPDMEESTNGAEILDESFLNRLEKRVEEATEEEIRAKWGKILAGEIRRPGTFSAKLMRLVDELEPETAKLFEDICCWRINGGIPAYLVVNLNSPQLKSLEAAGLFVPSEGGLLTEYIDTKAETWGFAFKNYLIAVPKQAVIVSGFSEPLEQYLRKNIPITKREEGKAPGIACYFLTREGMALASILEDKQQEAFYTYLKKLSEFLSDTEIGEFKKADDNSLELVRKWKNGKPLS